MNPSTKVHGKRGHKPARAFTIHLPRRQQLLVLDLPEARDFLEWQARVRAVELANRLLDLGVISQTKLARVLGMAQSRLSEYRRVYREQGAEALRPRRHLSGCKPRAGAQRQPARCSLRLDFPLPRA